MEPAGRSDDSWFILGGFNERAAPKDFSGAHQGMVQRVSLLGFRKELCAQPLIDRPLAPEQVHIAVGGEPKISRGNPSAGLIAARDLDPFAEGLFCDVIGPGIKESAKVIIPLLASQFAFEQAPGGIRFEDVANP